ncbi:putative ATP-dependent RNA helicase DHR1 [Thelohanellus kitauei]|uniref:Putative ATP-dependent RNA helicase DHR1 n=1 Tax=Thelohanellus kitauei TaxID=669202 RepID=A0A0C2JL91_THEKT|nr:putative ATP-dependent RNA helicase DHR1 [Thelohanellus kitauei]
MSATLCLDDFIKNDKLFKIKPPLISIEARQFPVQIHFSRRTPENYLESAFKRVCKIHTTLPAGHILVFVPSQQDVKYLCRLINDKFDSKISRKRKASIFSEYKIYGISLADSDNNSDTIDEDIVRMDESEMLCVGF